MDRNNRLAVFGISSGGNMNFHNPSGDEGWVSTVTANLLKLEVFSGCPQTITEINNAIFLPEYNCLFDCKGQRVLETCIRRGIQLDEVIDAPQTIPLPKSLSSVVKSLVFLGGINYHWGHFLTESISRLWCLDRYFSTKTKFLFFENRDSNVGNTYNSISTFLNSGTEEQLMYEGVVGPLRIQNAFVPSASFQNRGQAYSGHAIFPHKVADRMLVGRNPKLKSNQPVYFSRSRLSNSISGRLIRNEAQFENFLESIGVLICYPETITLEEQVKLLNEHNTFIGCWGSALHNLVFTLDISGVTLHILSGWRINSNYFLFDAILGLESHYINCLRPTPGVQQLDGPMIDMYIDMNIMLSYLSENEII
jgi:Glycosyltransferase 61